MGYWQNIFKVDPLNCQFHNLGKNKILVRTFPSWWRDLTGAQCRPPCDGSDSLPPAGSRHHDPLSGYSHQEDISHYIEDIENSKSLIYLNGKSFNCGSLYLLHILFYILFYISTYLTSHFNLNIFPVGGSL